MPLQGYREARHLIVSKQQLLNLARRSGALPTSARHPNVVQSPFRHSHAWPSTYDSKHIGLLGSVGVTEYALRDISIGGMISRGFRTRAPTAHKTFCGAKPPAATEVQPLSDGAALTEHRNVEPSREDQARMRAFAEGYHEGKATAPSSWSLISIARDFFVLSLFTAIAMYMFYGSKFKTLIIGPQNEVKPQEIDVRFDDVIGVEETKQELEDVVDFLKNPKKFSNLGGRLPKGVLLVGPPGTGKTLLARAVAGEAGVPFFHAAGPEFDEMLVGQGARRMRDLFSMAKARAPCVIFIDEIDSVGGKRSNSTLHPYANQTINQLLSEMDGFRQNEGVIVLGATNRRDDLDQALLRPGRFDIEVQVPPPDIVGRTDLLEYYLSKVKVDKDVDVKYLARGTTGFTGAAIENMVNQAALRSAIDGKDSVSQAYLEDARDKMLMGPERKNRVPDYEDNLLTAYHEAGHTLVAYYSEGAMPIHKVTIRARGSAVGHTAFIPSKDESYLTKSQILARIAAMLGGKVAEEMVFGSDKVTTGASSDLQNATELATSMIKHWGMSDRVGDRFFKPTNDSLFAVNDLSNSTSETIDQEIKRTLQESKMRAMDILRTHHAKLKLLAEALMEYETLDAKQVKRLLETGSLAQ